ncbi:MAG TPA: hypothetical protein VM841_05040 [Actinomycetota bacterium]|nr:hypothetical protein [Actinomycetota bacterium]
MSRRARLVAAAFAAVALFGSFARAETVSILSTATNEAVASTSEWGMYLPAGGSTTYSYQIVAKQGQTCVATSANPVHVTVIAPAEIDVTYPAAPQESDPENALTFRSCGAGQTVTIGGDTIGSFDITALADNVDVDPAKAGYTVHVLQSGSTDAVGDGVIVVDSYTDYRYQALPTQVPNSDGRSLACTLADEDGKRLVLALSAPAEIELQEPVVQDPENPITPDPVSELTFTSCNNATTVRFASSTPGTYQVTASVVEAPVGFDQSPTTVTVDVVAPVPAQNLNVTIDTPGGRLWSVPAMPGGLPAQTVGPIRVDSVKVGPVTIGPAEVGVSVTVGPVDGPKYPDAMVENITGTASFDRLDGSGVVVQFIGRNVQGEEVEMYTSPAQITCDVNLACTWSLRVPFVLPPGDYRIEATASQANAATSKIRDSKKVTVNATVL